MNVTPTSAPLTEAQIRASVEAELRATMAAQATTAAPAETTAAATQETTAMATQAATAAVTEPPATAVATETAATTAATTGATEATTAEAPATAVAAATTGEATATGAQPAGGAGAPAAAPGEPMLLVLSADERLSVFTNAGWIKPEFGSELRMQPPSEKYQVTCRPERAKVGFDAEGSAWMSCNNTATSKDGKNWQKPGGPYQSQLFFGPKGQIVGTGGDGLVITQNGVSKEYKAPESIASDKFPNRSAAYGPDGTLWVAGGSGGSVQLVSFDGQTWKKYGNSLVDLGLTENDTPRLILVTSKNEVFITTISNKLMKFEDGKFKQILDQKAWIAPINAPYSFSGDMHDMLEMPNGDIWIASTEGIFVWNRSDLKVLDRKEGLPATDVRDLALDNKGRVWAATAYGVAVQDGDKWKVIVPATSGLASTDTVAIALRGAIEPPAPDAQPKTATITGKLTQAGQPLADTSVELCSEELPRSSRRNVGDTPCEMQYFTQKVKSDAQGVYRFENVPVGVYSIVFRDRQQRWVQSFSGEFAALEPGQTVTQDYALKN
jgi:hypothetical protein